MSDEGIKNGSIAKPAVNMVPTDTRQPAANAARAHRIEIPRRLDDADQSAALRLSSRNKPVT
jgi:hypothetical protein